MALSEGTIIFNFQRAMQQAIELEEIATNLSNLAMSDFEGTLQKISMNWKGENSRNYLIKGENLKLDMCSTAGSLRGVASEIRDVAQRVYNAEMQALAIARAREYSNM